MTADWEPVYYVIFWGGKGVMWPSLIVFGLWRTNFWGEANYALHSQMTYLQAWLGDNRSKFVWLKIAVVVAYTMLTMIQLPAHACIITKLYTYYWCFWINNKIYICFFPKPLYGQKCTIPVSYTHLDVYKRQPWYIWKCWLYSDPANSVSKLFMTLPDLPFALCMVLMFFNSSPKILSSLVIWKISISFKSLPVLLSNMSTLERVSGILFSVPFMYSHAKLYSCNTSTHLDRRLWASLHVFKKDNALWSVRMTVLFPRMYVRNFPMVNTMLKSSFSVVV